MAFEAFDLTLHLIETARQCGLEPVGAVGRQMRGERRLRPPAPAVRSFGRRNWRACLRDRAAVEMCACCASGLKPHIVGRVQRGLTGKRAGLALHRSGALRIVIGFVFERLELLNRFSPLRGISSCLGSSRLAADAGIGRIIGCDRRAGRRPHRPSPGCLLVTTSCRIALGRFDLRGFGGGRMRAGSWRSS